MSSQQLHIQFARILSAKDPIIKALKFPFVLLSRAIVSNSTYGRDHALFGFFGHSNFGKRLAFYHIIDKG